MAENPKNEKKKKFVLKKEAIQSLTNTELERVGGGRIATEPGMGTPSVPSNPYHGVLGES